MSRENQQAAGFCEFSGNGISIVCRSEQMHVVYIQCVACGDTFHQNNSSFLIIFMDLFIFSMEKF